MWVRIPPGVPSSRGGISRRAGSRTLCRKAWGCKSLRAHQASVAQWTRAVSFYLTGRGFESLQGYQRRVSVMSGVHIKSEQLGIPFGTACHRLRKAVMFSLVARLGEDKCFKCGEQIASANDMTIEHKQPWQGVSSELFWDVGNIAFSHPWCNKAENIRGFRDRRSRINTPMDCPPGTAWCGDHKDFLPVEQFTRNKSRHGGLENLCRACRRVRRTKGA